MKYMIILILLLLFLAFPIFAEVSLEIPKGSNKWNPNKKDFSDALYIEYLNSIGNTSTATPKTSLYLKYDKENIYALFVCEEKEKNYPLSFKRSSTSNLMLDDAVMIVLGSSLGNSMHQNLQMGGYEGAYSEVAQADFYYQFLVNSEGVKGRTYNETPLSRPLFDSKVKKENNTWLISYKIPFSSWGMTEPENKEIFFNAFRSRPPERQGFYNTHYGGYTPFPLCKILLGQKPEIYENYNREPVPDKDNVVNDYSLRYYAVADQIVAQVKVDNLKGEGYLSAQIEGSEEIKAPLLDGEYINLPINIGSNPTLPIKAFSSVVINGKVVEEKEITVESIPEKPDYYNTQAGLLGISSVPTPWEAPKTDNNKIILSNKTITIDKSGFFGSVLGDEELLSMPITLGLSINNKLAKTESIDQKIENKGTYVVCETKLKVNDKYTCDIKLKIDFDGFTVVKIKSDDIDPETIDKLYLDIPLVPHKDEYIHREVSQTIEKLEGFGWSGTGSGPLWLGSHNMGIGFEQDMPTFLSENKRKQIEVFQVDSGTCLRLNFVDGKGQIKEKGHIFRFYLTPTPTKNYSLDKTGLYHGMDLWFENWCDQQGYPDMKKVPEMKERNEKDEAKDVQLIIYFSQSLASDSPASLDFFTDLTAYPERSWYKRAYEPGKDVPCYVSCLRELYGDLLLDRIEKLVKETGVNSVYLDGPANPWNCINPTHPYCESNAKITWNDDDICPYEATRNFLKRLRNILSSTGKPFKIVAHTGGAIYPSTMSLCDGHYEGEQMARFKPGYKLPLSAFAIGYCGTPWGLRVDELPVKPVYSVEQMRTLALLHDSCVGNGPYGEVGGAELEERIYGDFQGEDTKYYPYWEENKQIEYTGNSLLSYYVKPGSALLIFGNLTYDTDKVTFDASKLFEMGATIYNIGDKKLINDSIDKVNIEIKPFRYVAVRIDKEPINYELSDDLNLTEFEDFDIINSVEGFDCNKTCERDATSIKVKGIKYDTAAEIAFSKPAKEFNGEFNVEVDNILNIVVGDSTFLLQNGKWLANHISFWNEGLVIAGDFQEKVLNLKMSLNEDKFSLICNGKIVCENVTVNNTTGKFAFQTWNDDTIKVMPIKWTNKGEPLLKEIHPVR